MLLVLSLLASRPAGAIDFQFGELFRLFNARVSYGLLTRVQARDDDLVALASGGEAQSADLDDGNLNYDKGIVSNVVRGTAELTLAWRGLGAFVKGYGFYDFETKLNDRERTSLSDDAEKLVGADFGLLSHYLSARFPPQGGGRYLTVRALSDLAKTELKSPINWVGRRRSCISPRSPRTEHPSPTGGQREAAARRIGREPSRAGGRGRSHR